MKRFLTRAFDQGFIAVCTAVCTSPLLVLLFLGAQWVLWVWISMVVIVFLLGGIIDWCGSDEVNDDYPNYYL